MKKIKKAERTMDKKIKAIYYLMFNYTPIKVFSVNGDVYFSAFDYPWQYGPDNIIDCILKKLTREKWGV